LLPKLVNDPTQITVGDRGEPSYGKIWKASHPRTTSNRRQSWSTGTEGSWGTGERSRQPSTT